MRAFLRLQGKTLTAEAVAELLERPLYVQGAGDLGFDAATLENRLRDTLEIARVWKAVVLIDEADIFLEVSFGCITLEAESMLTPTTGSLAPRDQP